MNRLRRLHTYLGCFFAPLLIFFVATGWYQTWNPDRKKGVGEGGGWIGKMMTIHVDQILESAKATAYDPRPFQYLVILMSLALIATTLIGIFLAFRFSRQKWPIWISLALGVLAPVVVLWLGQKP